MQGAVLLYLSVAALFAIAFGAVETHAPGAFMMSAGGQLPTAHGVRTAALTYLSLTTITTTGHGNFAPNASACTQPGEL